MNIKLFAIALLCGLAYFIRHNGELFFNNFLSSGSLAAVLLMTYTSSVFYDIIKVNNDETLAANAPRAFKSPLTIIFMLLAIPCIIWPPIYVGSYDGWLAAILAYILLQAFGFGLSRLFDFKNARTAFHLLAAITAGAIGYYLSYMDFTNQSVAEHLAPYQTVALEQLDALKDWLLDMFEHGKNWFASLFRNI